MKYTYDDYENTPRLYYTLLLKKKKMPENSNFLFILKSKTSFLKKNLLIEHQCNFGKQKLHIKSVRFFYEFGRIITRFRQL